ncbi:endonuclease/exonuclease/phosphatase family protein [Planomonospora sp. ID67723]|uniref:endonuclease/exonuclease/phosphatase family protein n=1 Tax=Planomonospora sp. ID67723 TaxID=2738134 RepID=UPI0018C36362|nr:endonuclease/exonuclease/phosphatase family protein [Planomonospora sp. ID67723]MBG0831129.1 endonuclease/exonuclease/phosphatase family protein [Planomonospora sp. ID67723]
MRIRPDVTLGMVVLADVLRVFLPSLITLFGRAGSTPAELMGLYAVSWFAAAFLAVPLARLVPASRIALGAGVLLLAARLALQLTGGGNAQLYVASAGLLAGLVWLVATAMSARDSRPALAGVAAGLAASTVLHAALDGIDLMWRRGPVPWALLAAELVLFAAFLLRPERTPPRSPEEAGSAARAAGDGGASPAQATPEENPAAPRAWLLVGPVLLLWGLYTGNTAYAQATADAPAWTAAIVAGFAVLSLRPAVAPWRWHPLVPGAVLVASAAAFASLHLTIGGIHGVSPQAMVAAQALGQLALVACLAYAATAPGPGASGPVRRGLAVSGGMLLFVVLVFGYYAAYDLYLPNDWVPIAAALLVAALALAGTARRLEPGTARIGGRAPGWRTPVAALAAAGLVAAVPLWRGPVPSWEPAGEGLRVAAYNIRMGYGEPGRLSLEQQADTLRRMRPHVVVLSEADRGWLLNGGHDGVRLIAERLGMRFVWAPAADEVWGDAILTNLPVTSVRNHVLVQGGPTGAQALEVGLRWGDREITLIGTHLQPPPGWRELDQVEQLAGIVREAAKEHPVIVAGDLNIEPPDPAWRVLLEAGLTDPIAPVRPFNTIPSPGGSVEQIDHVLVTPGFTGRDQANVNVHHSDHRPIAVTLVPIK